MKFIKEDGNSRIENYTTSEGAHVCVVRQLAR